MSMFLALQGLYVKRMSSVAAIGRFQGVVVVIHLFLQDLEFAQIRQTARLTT